MPRFILSLRYLKMKKPSQVKNYVRYVATRPNAEKFEVNQSQREATEHQKRWIEKELKAHKELRESCEQEYEDYLENPTRENAMELINKIAEEGLAREDSMENYVGYLAKRPRAERGKQGHALWNGSDKEIDLNQVAKEAAEHNGNIWTFVLSLKREDAVRLGYDNANMWRELVRGKAPEIAKAMGIPLEHFVWYGAFHNEGHHPHIHLMCYSKNPKQGYLGRQNLMKLRSSFANEIFRDELYYIYEQKDEIMSVANKIKEITGYTSFLFRPPYGDYNSTLIDTVYGCNFYPIEWDVDSLDWKDYGTDNIIKTVTTHKALKNGSIILMHNGAKYTAEALESVITGLQSQGYEIVPVSQLINTENFHMDGTGLQIPD